jgi:hypothetical protein
MNHERLVQYVEAVSTVVVEEAIRARDYGEHRTSTSTSTSADNRSESGTVNGFFMEPHQLYRTVDGEFGSFMLLPSTCSRPGCGQPLIHGQRYNTEELVHSTLEDDDDEDPGDFDLVPPPTCDSCGEGPNGRPLFRNLFDHRWHHTVPRKDGRIQLCMRRSESAGDPDGNVGSTTSSYPVTPLHSLCASVSASA